MIEKILIFIIFLGPLVFFHELGHFLFARLFGVRVEVFSIGFGPKIFKYKKGFTEYAISLIPLGGYVKMFGDNPFSKDDLSPEERKISFSHKGKWARFWIVMGGPLANFIFAYVIFFFLFIGGEKVPEIKMGALKESSILFTKGVRPGDIITKVNGKDILGPSDLALEAAGNIQSMTVNRHGKRFSMGVKMKGEEFFKELTKFPPALRRPILSDKNGKLYWLGISELSNEEYSLESIVYESIGRGLFLKQIEGDDLEKGKFAFSGTTKIELTHNNAEQFWRELKKKGYFAHDLLIKSVNMNSPADTAGLLAQDLIVSISNRSVFSFEEIRATLQLTTEEAVTLEFFREGKLKKLQITPEVKKIEDKTYRLIGVYTSGVFQKLKLVKNPSIGFFGSIAKSFTRTIEAMEQTFSGFIKLITGQISVKSIGGPLTIGKVASDSFNTSLSYFFQLMALISINLGVINLFPIPVLDGGHIMFILLEIVNRGPLSRRKMEIAQQIGLSLLLILMVGALFNDFSFLF